MRIIYFIAGVCICFSSFAQVNSDKLKTEFSKYIFDTLSKHGHELYIIDTPFDYRILFDTNQFIQADRSCILSNNLSFNLSDLNTGSFDLEPGNGYKKISRSDISKLTRIKRKNNKLVIDNHVRVFIISNPSFTVDQKYCLFYFSSVSSDNSGSTNLSIYQHLGSKWVHFCDLYQDLR
jgi:hypothetical protein